MNRVVRTENGLIRGLPASDPRITSFKGIPFAAPPMGENRWRAPQPCQDWEGELKADEFGPIAMQEKGKPGRDNFWSREWAVDFDLPMSEDCLYLNVWAPADGYAVGDAEQYRKHEDDPVKRPGNLPVFVWFFGGGLQVGNTAEMEFDGERIARRGVVVVTVNYRLNAFGFLSHPDLTREDPSAPANFGFLDQQFAMKWVKRNIAAFGGDPGNITIGGQSSGGMSVCVHLANPANRGLFRRAVLESAVFIPAYAPKFIFGTDLAGGEEHGKVFLEKLGVRTIEEARKIPAEAILEAANQMPPHWFDSVIDGVYMNGPAYEWFLQPGHIDCPVFMTSTDIEMIMRPRNLKSREDLEKLAAGLEGLDRNAFLKLFEGLEDPEAILDAAAVSGIEMAGHAMAKSLESPVWMGRFSAEIPGWDHPGCFHSSDIWFYFENLAKCWRVFTGKHYDLSRQMCDYWANFMRTGDPNGMGTDGKMLPNWPRLGEDTPWRMEFGETAERTKADPSPVMKVLLDAFAVSHGLK